MSLTVYPYLRNPADGTLTEIEAAIDPNFTDLFGLESWRYKVWGATALKGIGCELLYSLKKTDLYAEEEDLYQLEKELIKVLSQAAAFSTILKVDEQSLANRIKNALAAIDVAKKYKNGGVCIG